MKKTLHSYTIGDRVELIVNHPDGNKTLLTGATGTVVKIGGQIGVRWDSPIERGHECNGICEYGFGWFVHADELTVIFDDDADIQQSDCDISVLI